MDEIITARDANQRFSQVLRSVRGGRQYTVTLNDKPVARIVPIEGTGKRVLTAEQQRALGRLTKFMRRGLPLGIGKFNRDDVYDDLLKRDERKRARAK